jgi:hypothetical protein
MLTRDGAQVVGVFIMTRDGKVSHDLEPAERERFKPILEKIIEDISTEPRPWTAYEGGEPIESRYKPGEPRWFNEVLRRLAGNGYESTMVDSARERPPDDSA